MYAILSTSVCGLVRISWLLLNFLYIIRIFLSLPSSSIASFMYPAFPSDYDSPLSIETRCEIAVRQKVSPAFMS